MINGDKTTRRCIKISCKTVVSTITKMPDVPQKQKENGVPNAKDGLFFLKECKSICETYEYNGVDEYGDII